MACATTGATFALHISTSLTITQQPFPPRTKPHHLTFPPLLLLPKTIPHSLISSSHHYKQYPNLLKFTSKSIDVSKDDKPISEQPPTITTTTTNSATPTSESDEFSLPPPAGEPQNLMDKRRQEEKFAELNTGIHECRSCGYRYDEAAGDPLYPIPPGLQFKKLPEDWRCPTCGAAKTFFESKSVEIAGFAQNQQFGLGGNALTASQKAVLIYGGLFLGFLLFLSGYFLQ